MPRSLSTRSSRVQAMFERLLGCDCRSALAFAAILLCSFRCVTAADFSAQANVPIEITFTAARAHDDPFNKVDLDVTFTAPNGSHLRVPAFWAGSNIWKARYSSPIPGAHHWASE